MIEHRQYIQNSIIADLAEGVMAIRFDGIIELVNEAALQILERRREELIEQNFARAFFTEDANDDFIQSILDTIYQKGKGQERYVPYRIGDTVKQLRIVSSYLHEGSEKAGVILVISDITELNEMRDAIKAMTTIQNLNQQLELRNRVLQETFGRYLSDDIVREILDTQGGWKLGGQKKKLTVLMSDLRGFTQLSERMRAQDLVEMVNHYFGLMYEEIEKYNGALIEFLGDGMMVIFGAPEPSETHASDAVAAAVAMQKRMGEVNRWNREHGFETLEMGIGVNTDMVILGNIGSERRTKYGVLGAAVNLTGRIESYTTGGQILISSSTRESIREVLQIRRTFRVLPKGLDREIILSDVTGIGDPYHISMDRQASETLISVFPTSVFYTVLEGKHADGMIRSGRILALSEAEALMEADELPEVFDNLLLTIGDGLYAKVTETEQEKNRFRICFTAKPPEFEEWKKQILQTGEEKVQ